MKSAFSSIFWKTAFDWLVDRNTGNPLSPQSDNHRKPKPILRVCKNGKERKGIEKEREGEKTGGKFYLTNGILVQGSTSFMTAMLEVRSHAYKQILK
jgi:hypothetical protein